MSGILIITKTVDENDQLLGFFIGWLREFAKKYHRINILCLEKGSFSLPDNIKVTSLGKDRGLPKFMWLGNLYKQAWKLRGEYDAVFVHMNAIYVVVGAWLWFLLGKKVFLWYAHKTITWQHRVAEKFAEGIFASTPQGFRLKTPKLHIVGQGIDMDLFRSAADQRLPNLSILSVGRIAPIKNYESLIGAAEILDRKGIDFLITIIGAPIYSQDVEYENKIRGIIKDKKLENKIVFVGKISNSNLPSFYQSHQIYINLSRTGSLDKTIVEAMASGCTVLSSNDSAREFLPSELIIPDDDPVGLADKIIEVKDKDYSGQLRDYVVKNHSLENLVDKISKQINAASHNKTIITGHPYAFPYYFEVFKYLENKSDFVFVLPKLWVAKKGKVRIKLEPKPNFTTYGLGTASYGGHGIGGLFKGWLPGIIFLLPYLKIKHDAKVLYSCSEPNLLTTLCNGVVAKLFGFKHIIFTWQNLFPETWLKGTKLKLYKFLVRLNLRFADGVICGNQKAEAVIKKFSMRVKTTICPISGVDTKMFKPAESVGVQAGDISKTILFYGAMDRRKGLDSLIRAMPIVLKKSDAMLILVGTGPERENLVSLATDLGIQDHIKFIDWMNNDELPNLLRKADVFVYPSVPTRGWEEQFGYAMAEASACGVPVVATRTGSIDEVVPDGKSGLLVEPNNPEQLAAAMAEILNDADLSKKMGESGRQYVIENFSHKVVANRIEKFLTQS